MGVVCRCGWLPFLLLLVSPRRALGQIAAATPWLDVCTAEEYTDYREELCPDTFRVSTLAFNPLYARAIANVTVLMQPSKDLAGSTQKQQYVTLDLPGFLAIGTVNPENGLLRDLSVTASNPSAVGQDPALSYNTNDNPLFKSPAEYDTLTRKLKLTVVVGQTLSASMDTEIVICCLKLPDSSVRDNLAYRIMGPTDLGDAIISIRDEPIKSTPYIDPGFQWEFLMVGFKPAVSMSPTVMSLTIRPANSISNRARIILKLPKIQRVLNESGVVYFNTGSSGDAGDWMFFAPEALWDKEMETITYFLRESKVLPAGREVTLSTIPGEFKLPVEMETNSQSLMVEARSFDNIDNIIRATAVFQSSPVPHVRMFTHSSISYSNNVPYEMSMVTLTFRTNRPCFVGTTIYLRLSGFQSQVTLVTLKGDTKVYFQNEVATFHLPENLIELKVVQTIYSDESDIVVQLLDLILPAALYANDSSLVIWNSDPGAPKQPVTMSPEVGGGIKTFLRSQLAFVPPEPRMPANITITLLPSIFFYQEDQIVLHLYGFRCVSSQIPLLGEDAFRINKRTAVWNAADYTLTLRVASNEIISNEKPFKIEIGMDTQFRLPDKLSQNDGILRIEGQGSIIHREPMKKVPAIGKEKFVIESRVVFEPVDRTVNAIARISFEIVLNTDVLPNSSIYIKLGGLTREPPGLPNGGVNADLRSGVIRLSGANAPLFVGEVGYWDQNEVMLTVEMIPTVQIYAGERIRFFMERDQYFKLPFSAYPNDPSFKLSIPEAGIPERPFLFSTRVSQEGKLFVISDLFYGNKGSVAYPNTIVEVNLKFRPNVNLPAGSIIRLKLPGFSNPNPQVPLAAQERIFNEKDLRQILMFVQWDQLSFELSIKVPAGNVIDRTETTVLRVMESGGFRLPSTPLEPNDQRLTIESTGSVIIYEEKIRMSPRVVDRSFMVSIFEYRPPQKESIFQLLMTLQPTVNISSTNDIIIFMPGFRNSLSKINIHIMGDDRFRLLDSMGQWNETTAQLRMKVPKGEIIPAFTMLDLRIEESQGFILPAALNANDTSIKIMSVGVINDNIQFEPIKMSPMVGNGPFSGHMFCMYQYEVGVRTASPICPTAMDCDPPLTDPCSPSELNRCGCDARVDEIVPLQVQGFNLQKEDQISFLTPDKLCSFASIGPFILSPFMSPSSQDRSEDGSMIIYNGISSIKTGIFRICVLHAGGVLYDVGTVTVRPSCRTPLVLVDGACVEHCPKTKIPIAGNCLRDEGALIADDTQALMIELRMTDPNTGGGPSVSELSSDNPEQRYFIYRYTYELAKLLNADPTRIKVASLNNGSVIVNTIFKPVGAWKDIKASSERSPFGLISLLRALQADTSSQLYQSSFFKFIDRYHMPTPLEVRECPDKVFRVFCPYDASIYSNVETYSMFIVGVIAVPVSLVLLCCAAWRVDMERPSSIDHDMLQKIKKDPRTVDPKLQMEYANSWLHGRFTGENWQEARMSFENYFAPKASKNPGIQASAKAIGN